MAEANAHYYAGRDPLGIAGDFITAPEISQMFGELVGIWLADLWTRAGRPAKARYVELGPGRGTLAEDALRAMRGAGLEPTLELVETSPMLRRAQAERLAAPRWHDEVATLPEDGPLLIVANEFFDALPIHQFDGDGEELRVTLQGDRFVRDPAEPATETSPASIAVLRALARRLEAQGGVALIVDYGHDRPGTGDTLQAVSRHRYVDPWQARRRPRSHRPCRLFGAGRGGPGRGRAPLRAGRTGRLARSDGHPAARLAGQGRAPSAPKRSPPPATG
jgi:SAM-dependent MidA family methyltransferase